MQLTTFVGRQREIAEIDNALRGTRVLTLTGAGGSGKTRLALEVLQQIQSAYADGSAWLELSALAEPALLPEHTAAVLGVHIDSARSATTALVKALRPLSFLLVLDNCEHLVAACAELTATLLRACPGLTVLATSREALGIAGERAWLVPPLSLPAVESEADPERVLASEAGQLFVARAQDVLPGFRVDGANAGAVAQICRRLDGIPLAIELAAARVKVLGCEQIAQRLDNAFALLNSGTRTALPRHRTLRATIDWSYNLLNAREQLLLQRLSVFAGGFTLEAAEAVCADQRIEGREVLDVLACLLDRSLVVMQEAQGVARYHLLETVRQYGAEFHHRNEHADAEATRHRHALFFLALAEKAEPHVYMGGQDERWFERLDAEVGNIRAGAEWFENAADADGALRLATALRWYWLERDSAEGRRQVERALALDSVSSSKVRTSALVSAGALRYLQDDFASMQPILGEAITTLREGGDSKLLSEALAWSALGLVAAGDIEAARDAADEALALARTIGGPASLPALGAAGMVARARGNLARAVQLLEENVRLARHLGLNWAALTTAAPLGRMIFEQGDYARAALCWRQGLGLDLHMPRRWSSVFCVEGLALVAQAQGDDKRAAQLFGAAAMLRERIGTKLQPFERDTAPLERLQTTLGAQVYEALFAEGRAFTISQAFEYAREDERTRDEETETHRGDVERAKPPRSTKDPSTMPSLRVRALGPLEIYRNGEMILPDVWRYARPKELLLLILLHPEGRTRDQIGMALWPDASPAQVKNTFHVTLHNLRKIVGPDVIIFEGDRYHVNPILAVEFDAAIFERDIKAALREAGTLEQLSGALALYRDDLLAEESMGDWHLEHRDHFRRLFVQGQLALGDRLAHIAQYANAAAAYERIILADDLHEKAYRGAMLCLTRAGDRIRALRHYERLTMLLREELSAEPETATTELFEKIRTPEHLGVV